MTTALKKIPVTYGAEEDRDLSSIFHQLLHDKKVTSEQLKNGIRRHIEKTLTTVPSGAVMDAAINEFFNSILAPNMSWKLFMTSLAIIGISDITLLV